MPRGVDRTDVAWVAGLMADAIAEARLRSGRVPVRLARREARVLRALDRAAAGFEARAADPEPPPLPSSRPRAEWDCEVRARAWREWHEGWTAFVFEVGRADGAGEVMEALAASVEREQ